MSESWYPGNYVPHPAYPPHYKTMPEYLRVEDEARPELSGRRQRFWTKTRDAALAQWAPTGIDLRVRDAVKPFGPNRVTLFIGNVADYGSQPRWGLHCFEACQPCHETVNGCDWVLIDAAHFEGAFLARNASGLKYAVAHEFGHSLGFGHGGDGIMDQTPSHAVVNAEEIAAARAYWLP